MGRSPDEIREDIARTRDAASQSAAALSEQLRPERRAAEVAGGSSTAPAGNRASRQRLWPSAS